MKSLYSQLPAIDSLLRDPALQPLLNQIGTTFATRQLRNMQQDAREHIQQHQTLPDWHTSWPDEALRRTQLQQQSALRPVFNLTGTVLHTNLGRAQLSDRAIDAVVNCLRQPVTLEYALDDAARGHRDRAVSALLCELTGAEAACIVNNNAAAVLLMLAALAPGREVIVSRGELVEIGGAFRIPDVMRQAGCALVEVGTTNRTHAKDYRAAIGENTGLLMKVHTSNYQIQGFTHAVSEAELVALADEYQLPVITDLGSGSLIDMTEFGLPAEPMPQQLIAAGVSLVSFSGDKLLGGPQAGIIVGKQALIDRLQSHPLKRALRVDKMTLAALEATLQLYRQPDTLREALPTLRLLTRTPHDILQQAERLMPALEQTFGENFSLAISACSSQIGSGSLPVERLASFAITFTPRDGSGSKLSSLAQCWRSLPHPVIGRIQEGKLWLDLRCLDDEAALIRALVP
jgi:L-seryl-tRNA(Ser) seleniumtransferase